MQARIADALGDIRKGGYANALIVTHAGPLHAMLHTLFAGRDAEMQQVLAVRFSPASVTRVALNGERAELLSLNEIAHLAM